MGNRLRETWRLILHRWRIEDEQPFGGICADPDVMRFIGEGSTRTSGQVARAIQIFQDEWEERRDGLFAVDLRSTGELIGFAGFSRPDFLPELLLSVEISGVSAKRIGARVMQLNLLAWPWTSGATPWETRS